MNTKAPSSKNINQVSVSTEASGSHTTVVALCSDGTIWRIVNIGTGAIPGVWSAWEQLPPMPKSTIDSQEE